jgi:hypothetical protein
MDSPQTENSARIFMLEVATPESDTKPEGGAAAWCTVAGGYDCSTYYALLR